MQGKGKHKRVGAPSLSVLAYPVFLVVVGLLVVACGGPEAPPVQEEPAPVEETWLIEEEESDLIEIAEVDSAMITFLTGDAYLITGDGEFFADIGDGLYPGDELRVETGYAELQVGAIGTVRVQEDSLIRLDDIVLQPGASTVDLRVVSGSILNKVERLTGNDSYDVRTETAVMGVRGTEFGITVDPSAGTRVAVRSGRVAVVPSAADPQRIRDRAAESGEAAEAIESAARRVEESALVIEADEEIDVDEKTAQEAEQVVREIDMIIEEVTTATATGQTVDVAAISARLDVATEESNRQISETAGRNRRTSTEETRQGLQEIDEIRVVALPQRMPEPVVPDEADVDIDAEAEEEIVEEPPRPTLVPLRLQVEPAEAQIWMDGRVLGRGRFAGVFTPGEALVFEVGLEGYSTETLRVTVEEARGRTYRVSLSPQAVPERAPEPEPEPEPEPVAFVVNATPATARIQFNGELQGTGSVRSSFLPGEEVVVTVQQEGYHGVEERFTIIEGEPQSVRFNLDRMMGTVDIGVTPTDATIRIDGAVAGTGRLESEYPLGTELRLSVERDGYFPREQIITVATGSTPLRFSLEERPPDTAMLTVTADPSDARILLNGASAGTGVARQSVTVGDTIRVTVDRPGFAPAEQTVRIGTAGNQVQMRLEPRPIEANVSVSNGRLVRGLASNDSIVIGVDGDGTVYGVNPAGRVAWRRDSANTANENGLAVVSGNTVLFSGATELLVLNASTGAVRSRRALTGGESHLFGRRPVAWNNQWILPADDELIVLGADGAPTGRTMAVPGGTKMTPVVVGNRLVFADQQGSVVIMNPANGSVQATIPTGMAQPVALAGAVDGSRVFLNGRRGVAVAVDVSNASVIWETTLPGGRGSFVDPVVAGNAVLYFLGEEIVALSRNNGAVLYRLSGATTPPLAVNNRLYYGATGSVLRVADPAGGRTVSNLRLPGSASTMPVAIGDRLAVGLENGRMVVVHPGGIR